MPRSQFETLANGQEKLSRGLADLNKEVREGREEVQEIFHGSGVDNVGLIERVRRLVDWQNSHMTDHNEKYIERRSQQRDLRSFFYEVGKLIAAAIIAIAMYSLTGSVPSWVRP